MNNLSILLVSPEVKDLKIKQSYDFPGGPLAKDSRAHAKDTGSIPGLGRPHRPQSSY